jgi:hypothetical protein
MAEAIGCSLLASAVPAIANNFIREQTRSSTNLATLANRGTPWVTVPVLSNTILLIYK